MVYMITFNSDVIYQNHIKNTLVGLDRTQHVKGTYVLFYSYLKRVSVPKNTIILHYIQRIGGSNETYLSGQLTKDLFYSLKTRFNLRQTWCHLGLINVWFWRKTCISLTFSQWFYITVQRKHLSEWVLMGFITSTNRDHFRH